MAAAGKEHKPLKKEYDRSYQRWYDIYNNFTPSAAAHLASERDEALKKWISHDYSAGRFTALLNIYHLLKGHGICTYHKYRIGGDYYSHNWHVRQWLDSGLIDGFTGEMADSLLQDGSDQ